MFAWPRRGPKPGAIVAAIAIPALLAACAAPPVQPAPSLPPLAVPLDVSYDWHVLLAAPFGSLLKDAPLTVHEVLLFHDEAPGASSSDEAECYALNVEPPRFLARQPEEFLLCYVHDRLSRIEATVRLPSSEALQVFTDACGLWMKNAAGQFADGCAGTDHGIGFSGRLEADGTSVESLLTVRLDGPTSPDR
jgi:hypothetical protein